jgi:branched-chain amino acid transport system ATP-binding protein
MSNPKVLALDEPSTGLAPNAAFTLFALLRELVDSGTTVLIVEQHAHLALQLADHLVVLDTGSVVVTGPAAELRNDPKLLGAYLG